MNIWILNHYAVPQKYYYLARSYNFAQELMNRGHTVTIFAASSVHNSDINLITDGSLYREMSEDSINYVLFYGRQYEGTGKDRIINHIDVAWKMVRHCPKFIDKYGKPDVIYASAGQTFTLVAGIKLAKKFGIKCVSEVTDLWPESFVAYDLIGRNSPILKLLYAGERWIYKKSDAVIFSMEGGADYILEKGWDTDHGGPIDMSKIHHINNGVDIDKFNSNKENFVYEDPDLNDKNIFKVVYTGSIRKVNKVEELVEVAKILQARKQNNVKFLLWGTGDYVELVRGKIAEYGLKNIELKGFVEKKYIPSILEKSDLNIYILPESPLFKFGISANKTFEYFASGKPVLASANSGYSIIDRYQCGICLEKFSLETLAEEIIRFNNMPNEEYDQYCTNASMAAENYDFNKLTDKLLTILSKE